ncbi:MAG: PHP domain-containing protein [Chloroflexi bacterium]|nr:PHP domain-containing protein [Chloroflexota bacterium]
MFSPVWPPPPTQAGWIRLDCHLHTAASGDARTTLEEVAQRVEAVHLDVVCITDHHAIEAAEALRRDLHIRVIVGEEIRTPAGEIIGLFLSERIPYVLPVPEVIHRIKAQGGLVYAPHAFDPERAGLRRAVLERLVAAGELDVIEVFNAKIADSAHNIAAADFATQFDIAPGVGSDAHDPEGIGAAYIEVPDFDGPHDMLSALRRGRVIGQYRPHAARYPTPRSAALTARDGTPCSPETAGSTWRA